MLLHDQIQYLNAAHRERLQTLSSRRGVTVSWTEWFGGSNRWLSLGVSIMISRRANRAWMPGVPPGPPRRPNGVTGSGRRLFVELGDSPGPGLVKDQLDPSRPVTWRSRAQARRGSRAAVDRASVRRDPRHTGLRLGHEWLTGKARQDLAATLSHQDRVADGDGVAPEVMEAWD